MMITKMMMRTTKRWCDLELSRRLFLRRSLQKSGGYVPLEYRNIGTLRLPTDMTIKEQCRGLKSTAGFSGGGRLGRSVLNTQIRVFGYVVGCMVLVKLGVGSFRT